MSNVTTAAPVKSVEIKAVVIRADGRIEPLGSVSYWHKNPLRRLFWRLFKKGK